MFAKWVAHYLFCVDARVVGGKNFMHAMGAPNIYIQLKNRYFNNPTRTLAKGQITPQNPKQPYSATTDNHLKEGQLYLKLI